MTCNNISNIREKLLPVMDKVGILIDNLGLCLFDVSMRTIAWSGTRIGEGNSITTDTPIVLGGPDGYGAGGNHRIGVRKLSSQEVVASGGLYRAGDYSIGPLTPLYFPNICFYPNGGGVVPQYFDPAVVPVEVLFNIKGPGMLPDGSWFKKIDQDVSNIFSYFFVVRADALTFG